MKSRIGKWMMLCSMILIAPLSSQAQNSTSLSWDRAEEILTHISEPTFPNYQVNVKDFGAKADGVTLDTKAFQDAIAHVSNHGGGKVLVPEGTFLIGSIELLSNVNLELESANTLVKFTTDINETNYPVVYGHWEATPIYNYRAFIYAYDAKNIAITGKGTFDGQASDKVWWNWKYQKEDAWTKDGVSLQERGSSLSREMNDEAVPYEKRIFGDGYYLRPNFIQIIKSENILLEGVTLNNSPMWQVNPVLSKNIIIRGMTLRSHGHNNDGVDPESSNYVLIENNIFDSGDDCIAIKSGRDRDGRTINVPSENIIIRNNTFADGHGGIALGSEMSGGIKNVFADSNLFDSPNLTYPLRMKTNAQRGGVIENIYLRNSVIKTVNQATIHGTMYYADGRSGKYLPEFKNIVIENVTASGGDYGIFLEAFDEVPITGLVLKNIEISNTKNAIRAMNWAPDAIMDNVVINGLPYPRPTEVRILGIPAAGEQLQATGLLIGDDAKKLSYEWQISDAKAGDYQTVATGSAFTIPDNAQGKFVKVIARFNKDRATASIPYLILDSTSVAGIASSSDISYPAGRIATKGIISPTNKIDLQRPITRAELAVMLANLWDLEQPKKPVKIADMDTTNPNYNKIAAVIESNMMSLKDNKFDPDGHITKQEMSTVAIMSCGVSYKNASTIFLTTFKDGADIKGNYLTNVERGSQLGLVKGDAEGNFLPNKIITYGDAITILSTISDFAGK